MSYLKLLSSCNVYKLLLNFTSIKIYYYCVFIMHTLETRGAHVTRGLYSYYIHTFALIYSVCFTRSLFRSRLWFIFFLAFSPQNKGHSKSNFYGLCIQILALVLFLYFLVLTLLVGYVKEPSFASYGHFCYAQDPVIHCWSPKYEQLLLFNFQVPFAIAFLRLKNVNDTDPYTLLFIFCLLIIKLKFIETCKIIRHSTVCVY